MYGLGVDIGGTTTKLGLFSDRGKLIRKWQIPTRNENKGSYILKDAISSIEETLENERIGMGDVVGIGFGIPGPVTSDGIVQGCKNLEWGFVSVAEEVKKLIGMDNVKAANDANVAALGEMWQGGGKGYRNILMVTLGTGVGGGVILNRDIVTGSKGAAGEIGHITVEYCEDDKCGCGNHGCLEQYASATGIVRMAKKALETSRTPSGLRNVRLSAKTIFDEAKAGDELAGQLVERFGMYLGIALSNVANVIDPEAFVIGGGVSEAGKIIPDVVEKYYNEYSIPELRNKDFKLALLGNDAGIYGSVWMALQDGKVRI